MSPLVVPAITTCPHCSVLVAGSCVVCGPLDQHPSCLHCQDGVYTPPADPWWRHELVWFSLMSVAAGIATALVVPPVVKALTGRKA